VLLTSGGTLEGLNSCIWTGIVLTLMITKTEIIYHQYYNTFLIITEYQTEHLHLTMKSDIRIYALVAVEAILTVKYFLTQIYDIKYCKELINSTYKIKTMHK